MKSISGLILVLAILIVSACGKDLSRPSENPKAAAPVLKGPPADFSRQHEEYLRRFQEERKLVGSDPDSYLAEAEKAENRDLDNAKRFYKDAESFVKIRSLRILNEKYPKYINFIKSVSADGYGSISHMVRTDTKGSIVAELSAGSSNLPFRSLEINQKVMGDGFRIELTFLPGEPKDLNPFVAFLAKNGLRIEKLVIPAQTGFKNYRSNFTWPRYVLSCDRKVSLQTFKDLLMYPSIVDLNW